MTSYIFSTVVGTSIAFVAAEDILILPFGAPAAALRFDVAGADRIVRLGPDSVRLLGMALGGSGFTGANLVTQDGSIVLFDGPANNVRTGTAQADWIGAERGGEDRIAAGDGDDFIKADAALGALDSIDGGAGTGDLLELSGSFTVVLGPLTVTGVERFAIGAGQAAITLDAQTVATATPGPGAFFVVDASAQGLGSRLVLDGRAAAAQGMALLGGAGDDSLAGGFGADSLVGGAGDDTLDGFWGDDTIAAGLGVDVLAGGVGADLFVFDVTGAPPSPPATPDLVLDFEGAGQAGGDRIALPGLAELGLGLTFHVGEADFVFEGYDGSGVQLAPGRIGDAFADLLWRRVDGQAWRFEVWLDLNDDGRITAGDLFLRLAAPPGATALVTLDFLAPFAGLVGSAAADMLVGVGQTDDTFWGEGGDDVLEGGDGVDVLEGGLGNDTLRGGDLADELRGGPGSDWLEGGGGWDTLFAFDNLTPETESPDDRNFLSGGDRLDQLFGGVGLDTLLGGADEDLLWGDGGDDSLLGGEGADLVHGREGADLLDGGEGDDTLLGGLGADTIAGGAGADLFIIDLSTGGQAEATGAEPDWITDFDPAAGDVLSLALIGGLAGGAFGPGPLAWRGLLPARELSAGVGLGTALPAGGLGPGTYQAWFIPALSGGAPAGGWLVVDLDPDLLIGADDAIIRLGGPGAPVALAPADFAEGTFRVLVGTAGADVLLAAAGGQEVVGLAGNDRLTGRGGDDRLVGGDGDDTLAGAAGTDQLWGGNGNDSLDGGEGDDELFVEGPGLEDQDGFFARNTLSGGEGRDSLWGGDGRESLAGGLGADWLHGGVGLDTLRGGDGDDTIDAGDGADLVEGEEGADSIDAGAGDDTVGYDPADPLVRGGDDLDLLVIRAAVGITLESNVDQVAGGGIALGFEGVDASAVATALLLAGTAQRNRLIGGAGDDRIEGREGNDTLEGGAGADTLDGGEGDDLLAGGAGADRLAGGAGTDVASYAAETAPVSVSLVTGGAGDTLSGFEGLRGSGFADWLGGDVLSNRLEGLAGDDTLAGFAGDDTLAGAAGRDRLLAGPGADSLVGGADADVLDGGADNDLVDGGEGADILYGGPGNDLLLADDTRDRVVEAAGGGADTVFATASTYLGANVEWLLLAPGAGAIFGVGNLGADRIRGNEAANLVIGMAGDDIAWGGEGNDRLQGREGNDSLLGEGGNDFVYGGLGSDTIDGGALRDNLQGQENNDTIFGGADTATDLLYGQAGDDWLDGGPGFDLMYGGTGNDVYLVSQANEGVFELAGQGIDRVVARGSFGSFALPAHVEQLDLDGVAWGIGNALGNRIVGAARAEALFGRDGADTLVGAGGNDALFGEGGRDAFLFAPGSGVDALRDYQPGFDRLLLQGFGFADAAAVLAVTRQAAAGAVVQLSPTDALILYGVQKAALGAADFVFLS